VGKILWGPQLGSFHRNERWVLLEGSGREEKKTSLGKRERKGDSPSSLGGGLKTLWGFNFNVRKEKKKEGRKALPRRMLREGEGFCPRRGEEGRSGHSQKGRKRNRSRRPLSL